MNHRLHATIERLPPCPECEAGRMAPCRDDAGRLREPHRVRMRIVAGDVFVIEATDARRRRVLRSIRELAATLPPRRRIG